MTTSPRSPAAATVRLIAAIGLITGVNSCSGSVQPPCGAGSGSPRQIFTLYFGKTIPGRADLTENEWRTFLETTITANLPDGYTAFDATGGWMNPISHKTIREDTKVLIVALPEAPESLVAVNRVRTAYQTEFHQQLVGMTVEHACAAF